MSDTKSVILQELVMLDLLNVYYDLAGQLILVSHQNQASSLNIHPTSVKLELSSQRTLRKLTIQEQTHLKAAFYWLNIYKPDPDASNLEQVRGYLEAFDHLCEISAWHAASQILFTSTKFNQVRELHEQLQIGGYYKEQIELYTQLIGKLTPDLDCIFLQGLGKAYRYLGQTHKAIDYHNKELNIAHKTSNKLAESKALSGLGSVYFAQHKYQDSVKCFEQQLAIACEIKDKKQEGWARGCLGGIYLFKGNYRKGHKLCQQALVLASELSDQEMAGEILGFLGGTYLARGRYQQAIPYLQRQLDISSQIDNQCQKYTALYYLGNSYFLTGQYQVAIEYLNSALTFAQTTVSLPTEAAILCALGGIYSNHLKQYQKAIVYYQQALKISRQIGNQTTESITLSNLSSCYGCLQQYQLASQYFEQALTLACKINHREAKGVAIACLANVYLHQKQYIQALWLVFKSLLLLPPWTSANGIFIFRRMIEEITQLANQAIRYCWSWSFWLAAIKKKT